MALKHQLTAFEYTALSEELKSHYKLQGNGSYSLDLGEGFYVYDKDPIPLLNALEKEREETKKAKAAADKLEAEKRAAEAAKLTDGEEIRKHYQKELDDFKKGIAEEKRQAAAELKAQRERAASSSANTQALQLSTELFGDNAMLMLPHMQNRLKGIVNAEGNVLVQIIDPMTGTPALDQNFENFKKAVSTDPLFKSMVVASRGSGGSANDQNKSGSLATTKSDGSPKKFSDYNSGELVQLKRFQPEVFKKLLEEKG